MRIDLPEKIREDIEYLQYNTIASSRKKITKKLAVQIAIQVYAHFIRERKGGKTNL